MDDLYECGFDDGVKSVSNSMTFTISRKLFIQFAAYTISIATFGNLIAIALFFRGASLVCGH